MMQATFEMFLLVSFLRRPFHPTPIRLATHNTQTILPPPPPSLRRHTHRIGPRLRASIRRHFSSPFPAGAAPFLRSHYYHCSFPFPADPAAFSPRHYPREPAARGPHPHTQPDQHASRLGPLRLQRGSRGILALDAAVAAVPRPRYPCESVVRPAVLEHFHARSVRGSGRGSGSTVGSRA